MSNATKTPRKTAAQMRAEAGAAPDPKAAQQLAAERAAAREHLSGTTIEKLLTGLATLSVDMGAALSGVGEQIRAAHASLKHLTVANAEQEARLRELHGIEAARTSMDQLLAEYAEKERELAERAEAERKAREAAEAEREAEWKAEDDERATQREREEAAYEYATAQRRRQEDDAYAFAKTQRDRAEEAERAARKAELDARERELKAKEQEHAETKAKVDGFEAQTKKAVAEAVGAAVGAEKRRLEHEHALAVAGLNGRLALADQAKATLEAQLKAKDAELARVNEEAKELRGQVQTIATKALDSAAGARALDEVRSIAKEQAQGMGGKGSRQ